jgi:GxxExxY protein
MLKLMHAEVTGQVIGAAFEVWKTLGYGFLEKVYENALVNEIKRTGLTVQQQFRMDVCYKGIVVGQYAADLFVMGGVIVEVKAEKEHNPKHQAQLLNYLRASGIRVGLLINFGERKCYL